MTASAWLGAWAEHVAPDDTRTAVVLDEARLVGVLPFALHRPQGRFPRLRLLGADTVTGLEPLAEPGREDAVAALGARALAAGTPEAASVGLDGVPVSGGWAERLPLAWPGVRPRMIGPRRDMAAPHVDLADRDFEGWLAGRSSHLRKRLRRVRRQLAEHGVHARRTQRPEELGRDLDAFFSLHAARWAQRGGSGVVTPAIEAMVRQAAPALLAQGRLDLHSLETEDRILCSHLYFTGGSQTTWWLHGYDDSWKHSELTLGGMTAVIEDAAARGLRGVSLGAGAQSYKRRLSDRNDTLGWRTFALPGARLGAAMAEQLTERGRHKASDELPEEGKALVRRVLRGPAG